MTTTTMTMTMIMTMLVVLMTLMMTMRMMRMMMTVIFIYRNIGVGTSTASARIGSMCSPFIVYTVSNKNNAILYIFSRFIHALYYSFWEKTDEGRITSSNIFPVVAISVMLLAFAWMCWVAMKGKLAADRNTLLRKAPSSSTCLFQS